MSDENTYLYNPESAEEMARLSRQGRMLTEALTLLPLDPLNLLNQAQPLQVLDIGSGPGDWALDLAVKCPSVRVIGIDISKRMVAYAKAQAESQETPNVEFREMNALKPLEFPDASFDLINLRVAVGFVPREKWLPMLQECKRKLRPGGFLLSTEGENGVHTYESPNTAQLIHWLSQALFVRGLGFWDQHGSMHGIHGKLLHFLKEVGFENRETKLCLVDASYGSQQYLGWLDHHRETVKYIEPIVCREPPGGLGVSKDRFEEVLDASFLEARQSTFCSYTYFMTVSGQKPWL